MLIRILPTIGSRLPPKEVAALAITYSDNNSSFDCVLLRKERLKRHKINTTEQQLYAPNSSNSPDLFLLSCYLICQALKNAEYYSDLRNRSALNITDAELKLIASAANIGDSNKPRNGYRTPAANGTPSEL